MKISEKKTGFTLVEILVVCGISVVFLGTAIMLMTNFQQGFSRSENTAILMQESALFIAKLRTDLNNAVLATGGMSGTLDKQILALPNQLSFNVYSSQHGKILPVIYSYEAATNGGTIKRKEANDAEKPLISNYVASLAWQLQIERFATPGSGTFRISVALDLQLKVASGKEKPFAIKTSIFPARLNRQLNSP